MNNTFNWDIPKQPGSPHGRARLKLKLPMQQVVVDVNGNMYDYIFLGKKLTYRYLGSVTFN